MNYQFDALSNHYNGLFESSLLALAGIGGSAILMVNGRPGWAVAAGLAGGLGAILTIYHGNKIMEINESQPDEAEAQEKPAE